MPDLLTIRDAHAGLRSAIITHPTPDQALALKSRIEALLRDITDFADTVTSVEDYLWLRDASEYWKAAGPLIGYDFQPVLKPPPREQLSKRSSPASHPSPAVDLGNWVRNKAFEVAKTRALEWHSQHSVDEVLALYARERPGEDTQNWLRAEAHLALAVLDGELYLITQFSRSTYSKLEGHQGGAWVRSVRELKAYYIWKARGCGWGMAEKDADYMAAWNDWQAAIATPARKAPVSAFASFEKYIAEDFLDGTGRVSFSKPKVEQWVESKASVLGWPNGWKVASNFMRDFYENITRAVLACDAGANARVLAALGMRPGSERCQDMLNCFELALGIYFLDPDIAAQVSRQPLTYSELN